MFYRQLAQLLSGGIPIIGAVEMLSTHAGHSQLRQVARQLKQYLIEGCSLGDAFAKFPGIFPAWQINIVKYGEEAGRLAEGLGRLADYLEKDYATLMRVIVGLAYPVLLLHVAIFLLPLSRLSCFGGYIFAVFKPLGIIYGSLFLIFVAVRLLNNAQFKKYFDALVLAIPVVGKVVRQVAVARFVRALQCLCSSGVGIINAWKMAAQACGNSVIKDKALGGVVLLEQGKELSQAFVQAQILNPEMLGMIFTAEKTGSIAQTLDIIANYTEKDNNAAIDVLAGVIPVLVYLFIAGFIALRIISFYNSYFNRISTTR